jgi:hypothetical protein
MKGAWVVLAVTAFFLAGCGTVCNLASNEPEIYGGVAKDVEFASIPHFDVKEGSGGGAAVLLGLWLAEACLCGAGDTLTVPVVLYRQARMERFSVPASGPETEVGQVGLSPPVQDTAGAEVAPPPLQPEANRGLPPTAMPPPFLDRPVRSRVGCARRQRAGAAASAPTP